MGSQPSSPYAPNDVCKYLFEINEKPRTEYAQCLGASVIGSISNTLDHGSWALKGMLLEEKQKSKGFRIHQRGTFQEQKVRSDACFAPAIHSAYKHTDRNMS